MNKAKITSFRMTHIKAAQSFSHHTFARRLGPIIKGTKPTINMHSTCDKGSRIFNQKKNDKGFVYLLSNYRL